ncbi:MAG: HD domain-containing protein [Clostridia bacterium]|nr:HD domain-containing protein [Clostridia bacterium]
MIDFKQAQKSFKEYLQQYNLEYGKNELKIKHTYGVVKASEFIAKKLVLKEEDIELAKLIGLLHDIGRFEQIKKIDCFLDNKGVDHAILGNEILFKNNLIENFIKDEKYYNIISKAILNHNRLSIEDNLNDRELLHVKIIRDADKTDNFRVKATENFENIIDNANKEILENDIISEKIFKDFMNNKIIVREDRNTYMDFWVSYIAFIFDFNYIYGLEYIKENDYINKIINRLDYKKIDTKEKMQKIKKHANQYVENRLK